MLELNSTLRLSSLREPLQFHASRFGGGLPPRGQPDAPPAEPTEAESLYLRKLLDAYGDHLGKDVADRVELDPYPDLERHYNR